MECNVGAVNATIRTFGRSIHSIDTIEAVDSTVDQLVREQGVLSDSISIISDLIDRIVNCSDGVPIDTADGDVMDSLEESQSIIRNLYQAYNSRLEKVSSSKQLATNHINDITGEIRRAIGLVSELFEITEQLRWAIMEHDADLSEATGKFDNVEDLIKHLRAS